MRSPRSYTRENVVEIQSHAGPAVLEKIYRLVLENGAEPAEPGEFTKRAFLNGRIDLTQAEAVADLIEADSELAAKRAIGQLIGRLTKPVTRITDAILEVAATIEAEIEFSDETGLPSAVVDCSGPLRSIQSELQALIESHESGKIVRDGYRIAICGKPNVGKSSLMNRLVQDDRVLVAEVAGTTRDIVQEKILLGGHLVVVSDMAGIHDEGDVVENMGIDKAWRCIDEANLILFVVDLARPVDRNDQAIFNAVRDKKAIVVKNKVDLLPDSNVPTLPSFLRGLTSVSVSAKFDRHIETLKKMISDQVSVISRSENPLEVSPNCRQVFLMKQAMVELEDALLAIAHGVTPELVAENLYAVSRKMDGILGKQIDNDILDRIFQRFCIGK